MDGLDYPCRLTGTALRPRSGPMHSPPQLIVYGNQAGLGNPN